jgi:glucosamine--fructose-6-phosphate aminotransferase (isomerizing)
MCGIIGYVGKRAAAPILVEGLRHLEYRGYDSAGIACLDGGRLVVRKRRGKIDEGLALEPSAPAKDRSSPSPPAATTASPSSPTMSSGYPPPSSRSSPC